MLKEIAEPAGAVIKASNFQLGDPTLSVLEVWGAEYQESNALLLKRQDRDLLKRVAERERCPVCFVGHITGDGKVKYSNTLLLRRQDREGGRRLGWDGGPEFYDITDELSPSL